MFVEKLSKNDIVKYYDDVIYKGLNKTFYEKGLHDYLDLYTSKDIENYVIDNGVICFNVRNLNFKISDFDIVTNSEMRLKKHAHNEKWLKFMYKKFGENYLNEFCKLRESNKQTAINDLSAEFDKKTKQYCDAIKQEDLTK